MARDLYCGGCHAWMTEMFSNIWVCDCTVSGQAADTSKDPNCHNSRHDHHDPQSPIVLARQAEYAAEKESGCTCIGSFLDRHQNDQGFQRIDASQPCPVHPIIEEEPEPDERPFFEVIDELDEILEDTNQQVECICSSGFWEDMGEDCPVHSRAGFVAREGPTDRPGGLFEEPSSDTCLLYGHVWVKMMHSGGGWGPVQCLRCARPAPEDLWRPERVVPMRLPCIVHSYFLDGEPVCEICGQRMDEMEPWPTEKKPEPKHACPGCNLRDLTMQDAKEHIRKLLIEAANTQTARDAAQWMRLDGKIRAWER